MEAWNAAAGLLGRVAAYWRSPDVVWTMVALGAFLVLVVALEARGGRDVGRYRSAHFATDTLYMLLTVGGLYSILAWKPIATVLTALVKAVAPGLPLDPRGWLPAFLHFAVFLVAVDFVRYWKHRWMHANRYLWAFHSIHHSQPQLTFMTGYRVHLLDFLLDNVCIFAVGLLLGVPPALWLPVNVAIIWYQALQHSDLDWSYGPLDWVLVSPRVHSVHHSVDPAHADRNFGQFFSIWDTLFGTARLLPGRPPTYGVGAFRMEESFLAQLVFPFRQLRDAYRRARRRRSSVPA